MDNKERRSFLSRMKEDASRPRSVIIIYAFVAVYLGYTAFEMIQSVIKEEVVGMMRIYYIVAPILIAAVIVWMIVTIVRILINLKNTDETSENKENI